MTLKEKFDKNVRHDENGIESEVCVLIADDFAIGFAYWCEWRDDRAFKTYEELLEIYKKEKGL